MKSYQISNYQHNKYWVSESHPKNPSTMPVIPLKRERVQMQIAVCSIFG